MIDMPQLTKRVTMIELFYDLVFAYMISQATSLIHHLSHGTVSPISFLIFAVVVIVFINSWMVQSVFTNRFGSSSWTDIAFYFVDMMILLYMTNSFGNTSSENMTTFFMAASLLSLPLLLQYLIVYFKADYQADKDIAKVFSGILLFRTLTLLIGGLSNAGWARLVAFLGSSSAGSYQALQVNILRSIRLSSLTYLKDWLCWSLLRLVRRSLVLLITLSQAIPQLTQFLSSLLLLAYSLLTSQSSIT